MAHYRTSPLSRARRELAVLKTAMGVALTLFAFAGLTGAAHAPDDGVVMQVASLEQPVAPKLSRVGGDVIITGSIGNLFASGSFTGTNKALKQDRARPEIDPMEVERGFDAIRARIAALRHPAKPVEAPPVPGVQPQRSPIQVAAIEPEVSTPALAAIDQMAVPGSNAPVPLTMSSKLAYARADLPATEFDDSVLHDKLGKVVAEKQLGCMATAIYFEARGESYRGQVAVGQVVMNRVAHRLYPDTICAVVFQNQNQRNACQFSFACDGIPEHVDDPKAWKQAMDIARDVISGKDYLPEVGYATHYHATYVSPHWAPRMKKVTKIGMHVFYQFKRGWKFG
jgi:hypothetical protein